MNWCRCLLQKLLQKSHVALVEQLNIVNPILQHGDAFHAHAKGKAAYFGGFVAIGFHEFEYGGVHHAAAQQFNPTVVFAQATACASTFEAGNRDICAGLSEWKERWEETRLHIGP